MDEFIKYSILILYILGMIAIAFFTRRKSSSVNETLLGGGKIGGWMTAFAYGTTYFSAVIFIGYSGQFGYDFGLAAVLIGVGNAIVGSFLAWKILAKRTRRITGVLKTRTMPEYFEARYESKYLKLIAASITVIFLIPYSASVYKGLGYMFESIFNINFVGVVLIMAALTATYVFFGGYLAAALSDFVQGIIMLVGIAVMIIFVFNYGQVNGLLDGLSKIVSTRSELGISKINVFNLIILILLTSLGPWGLPQILQKFQSVKNDDGAIRKATYVSTGFALIIGVGAYLTGCTVLLFFDNVKSIPIDERIPLLLTKTLPAGLLGLVAVLILSASMSTLASIALTAGSGSTVDIYKGYLKKDVSDKKLNILTKSACVVLIILSALLAIVNQYSKTFTIVNLMSLSWGILCGCFIGPFVYGLYMKKANKTGVYASIIGTLIITLTLYIISKSVPDTASILTPPAIGVITILYSLICMPLVSLFTQPPTQELLEKIGL